MNQRLAVWVLQRRGWQLVGEAPHLSKYLIVFGPHTCNWDFPLAMLAAAGFGIHLRWLGKHTIFRWPVAGFLRRLGGIPVRRERHEGVVEQIAAAFSAADTLVIGMTPEGTRAPRPYWRSGFYHMAQAAGVPIVPASLDRPSRQITMGRALLLSGDACRDMDALRAFFGGARGIRPEKAGAVRLREEEGLPGSRADNAPE